MVVNYLQRDSLYREKAYKVGKEAKEKNKVACKLLRDQAELPGLISAVAASPERPLAPNLVQEIQILMDVEPLSRFKIGTMVQSIPNTTPGIHPKYYESFAESVSGSVYSWALDGNKYILF